MKKIYLALGLVTLSALAHAQMTPLGAWNTIDDKTGKPKALIRITANAAGGLSGVVEKALEVNPSTEPNCDKCTDDQIGRASCRERVFRAV